MTSWQRAAMVTACRRLHARGLIAGTEGNISVRLDAYRALITPAGADKATLTADDLVTISLGPSADGPNRHDPLSEDIDGDDPGRDSGRRASSEVEMHRACYAERSDIRAVVHAHPPVATGMATAGYGLPPNIHPELPVVVGPVALVPYARPGTVALGASMRPWLGTHDVFLLSNHGVTTVGASLDDAVHRMESTEQAARIFVVAQLLGGARILPDDEVAALVALHPRFSRHLNQDRI